MKNTVILVRCIEYSAPVAALVEVLQKEYPAVRIIAVPDLNNKSVGQHERILGNFPVETLPITREFVMDSALPSAGARTGWLCGDYVIYRGLDVEWEYAWVVEPDVCFLNGSSALLGELGQFQHDLIATNYAEAKPSWTWYPPLTSAMPDLNVHAITFPLIRASRVLAHNAMSLRREAESNRPPEQRIPNDESIVATAAFEGRHSVLDLRKLFPALFKYWTTTLKLPLEDIAQFETEPRVVHSAVYPDHFDRYLALLWKQMAEGNPDGKEKLLKLLDIMSPATLRSFVSRISQSRLDGDYNI